MNCSDPNCLSCSQFMCTSCINGFILEKGSCIMKCNIPCETCNVSSTLCLTCILGYTFDATLPSNCRPNSSPNTTLINYMICPFGYILSNSGCSACLTTSNCARCNSSNLAQCTSCLDGFYLNQTGFCFQCSANCAKCLANNVCLECSDGYIADTSVYSITTISRPINCISCMSPCKSCAFEAQNCLSCISGFTYSKGRCWSSLHYRVKLTLMSNFQ
jgi:proprotein convertase subtilisin/kexin type 5